ncbi:hypothetical protein ACIRD3_06005 [Kitasatospora sp. NPDC093550]
MTIHGLDVGRRLDRQRQHIVWQALTDGRRTADGPTGLPMTY